MTTELPGLPGESPLRPHWDAGRDAEPDAVSAAAGGGPTGVGAEDPDHTVRAVREAARQQARGLSGVMVALLGALAAIVLMVGFILLDYQFNQASHRLFKILLGCMGAACIVLQPHFGLWLIPVASPFLTMLPKVPVPGLNSLNALLLMVFFSFALVRVLSRQSFLRPARLGPWIGGFMLLATLSILRGAAFPTGLEYNWGAASLALFRGGVSFLGYFIALSMVRGERDRRIYALAIVAGLAAEAVATIMWGGNGTEGRAVGSLGQANDLGAFLAIYTAITAALVFGARSIPLRLMLVAATLAGTWALLLSASRAAVFSLAAALLFIALRSSRLLLALVVLALLTSPLWIPERLKERIMSTQVEAEDTDEVELEGSAQARVETWTTIMKVVSHHPIEGVGFNGLGQLLQETGADMGLYIVKDSAHNTFLRIWGELGLIGLGLFIGLLVACVRLAFDTARAATNRFDRQLGIGLAAAVIAWVISCAFGDRFFRFEIGGSVWLLCGLVNDAWLEQRGARA